MHIYIYTYVYNIIYTCRLNHQNHDDDDDDKDNNTTMRTISYDDEMHHSSTNFIRKSSLEACQVASAAKQHLFTLQIPSESLTWNLKMVTWNRRFLLETIIFRFHVKLGECIHHFSISFLPGLGSFCPLVGGLETQSVAGWRRIVICRAGQKQGKYAYKGSSCQNPDFITLPSSQWNVIFLNSCHGLSEISLYIYIIIYIYIDKRSPQKNPPLLHQRQAGNKANNPSNLPGRPIAFQQRCKPAGTHPCQQSPAVREHVVFFEWP